MKKYILSFALFIFLFLLIFSSNTYAQSSDCWQEFNDQRSACDQSIEKCNACLGQGENPACTASCNKSTDECSQAVKKLQACLGFDKEPLTIQPAKEGHLTCGEWKKLWLAGTATNCTIPVVYEKVKLKCLSSITDTPMVPNLPTAYVLDFDTDSCLPTQDDLRRLKAGFPLTSETSSGTSQNKTNSTTQKSQNTNPVSKFVRDVGNYFKPSGINAGKDVKPDFAVDKPPFKDSKSVAEQAKISGPAQAINSWIEEVFGEAAPVVPISDPETLNRAPKLTDKAVSQAKAKSDPQKSPYQIPVLDGEAMVKLPNSSEWIPIKEGDRIVPGSTIFTGMDTTTVLMIEDKGAVQISSFTEITVSDPGLKQASKEGKTYIDLKLHTGEVEVNVEGGVLPATLQIQTTNAVAGVRGTHFWVNYNSSKGVSIVGVYKGTVDVKDNLNNEKAISPQNDKIEAVLISKQFSTTKLIIYGLAIAVIGAVLLILKRRVFSKKSGKNKKS